MSTLVVKHMPVVLADHKIKEFFDHYGAIDVNCMQGKMVCHAALIARIYSLFFKKRGELCL